MSSNIWARLFWQIVCVADREPIPAHLPLAWTHSSAEEIQSFIAQLEALARGVQPQREADPKGPLDPLKPQFV